MPRRRALVDELVDGFEDFIVDFVETGYQYVLEGMQPPKVQAKPRRTKPRLRKPRLRKAIAPPAKPKADVKDSDGKVLDAEWEEI